MKKLLNFSIIFLLVIFCFCSNEKTETEISESDIDYEDIHEAKKMLNNWISFSNDTLKALRNLNPEDTDKFNIYFNSFIESANLFSKEEAEFLEQYPDFDLYENPQLKEEWEQLKSINDKILELSEKFR